MAGMSSRTMRPIRADRETPVLTHLAHHGGGHPAARRGGDASNRKAPGDGDANIGNRAAAPVFSPLHSNNRARRRADCDLPGTISIPDRRSTVASKRASYGTEGRSQRRPNRETGRNLQYPRGKAASASHKNRKLPDTGIALLHLERKHVLTRRRCLDVWQNRSRRPTCISAKWVRYRSPGQLSRRACLTAHQSRAPAIAPQGNRTAMDKTVAMGPLSLVPHLLHGFRSSAPLQPHPTARSAPRPARSPSVRRTYPQ